MIDRRQPVVSLGETSRGLYIAKPGKTSLQYNQDVWCHAEWRGISVLEGEQQLTRMVQPFRYRFIHTESFAATGEQLASTVELQAEERLVVISIDNDSLQARFP